MVAQVRYRSVVSDSARWEGFRFRDDDIVISTPPKCGTTWTQLLVAQLVLGTTDLPRRLAELSPWFDMQLANPAEVAALLEAQTHRRFIKTHTPLDGLPYDERVTYICVGRDPRDVAVSCSHHLANLDLEQFLAVRQRAVGLADLAELGVELPAEGQDPPHRRPDPLTEYLDTDFAATSLSVMTLSFVLRHLQTFWDRRAAANIALFHYTDLQADLPGQIQRLAGVLGVEVTAEQVKAMAAAASFESMRGNAEMVAPNSDIALWRSTTDFFHRGSNGQWREVFDEATLDHYEERAAKLATPELLAWAHAGRAEQRRCC
jgi:aryl sulfotransferase